MRAPDQWARVFADLPRRRDLDKRAAAQRAAKHYRINEQEGKLNPCMSCGVATAATPTGAGRSDTILASGEVMRLCMSCSRLDRRARARKAAKAKLPEKRPKRRAPGRPL